MSAKNDAARRRQRRIEKRAQNAAGRAWLLQELADRQWKAVDLYREMERYGTVKYATVTTYTRGESSIRNNAEVIAHALGVHVADVFDAAAGRNTQLLERNQWERRILRRFGITPETPEYQIRHLEDESQRLRRTLRDHDAERDLTDDAAEKSVRYKRSRSRPLMLYF